MIGVFAPVLTGFKCQFEDFVKLNRIINLISKYYTSNYALACII